MERITYIPEDKQVVCSNDEEFIVCPDVELEHVEGLHAVTLYGDQVVLEWGDHLKMYQNTTGCSGLPVDYLDQLRAAVEQERSRMAAWKKEQEELIAKLEQERLEQEASQVEAE